MVKDASTDLLGQSLQEKVVVLEAHVCRICQCSGTVLFQVVEEVVVVHGCHGIKWAYVVMVSSCIHLAFGRYRKGKFVDTYAISLLDAELYEREH